MENATMWAYEHLKPHYSVIPTGFSPNRGMRLNMELEAFDENTMPKKYDETVFSYGINLTVRFTELNAIAKRCIKLLINDGKLKAVTPEMSIPIDADVMTKITTCCIENTHEERKLIVDAICEELYKTPMPYSGQMVQATIEKTRPYTEAMSYIRDNFMLKWGTIYGDRGWSFTMSPFGYTVLDTTRTFEHHDKTFTLKELGSRVIAGIYSYIMDDPQYGPMYAKACHDAVSIGPGPASFVNLAELNHISATISEKIRNMPNFDAFIEQYLDGENQIIEVEKKFNDYTNRTMFPNRPQIDAIDYMIRYFHPTWVGSVESTCRYAPATLNISFDPYGGRDRPTYLGPAYVYNGNAYTEFDLAKTATALFFDQILKSNSMLSSFQNIYAQFQWEPCDDRTAKMITEQYTALADSIRETVLQSMVRDFHIVSDEEYVSTVEKFNRNIMHM